MCVEAGPPSGRRKKREFDMSQVDNKADNVAYIDIIVLDKNDNGPKFTRDTVVGGEEFFCARKAKCEIFEEKPSEEVLTLTHNFWLNEILLLPTPSPAVRQ